MKDIFVLLLILLPFTIPITIIHTIKKNERKNRSYPPYNYPPQYYNNNYPPLMFGNTPTPTRNTYVQPPASALYNKETDAPEPTAIPSEPEAAEKKPKKQKPDMTSSTILFLIGTIFVVLSGLAFGVAGWVHTSYTGRVLIIAAASLVSFFISGLMKKLLKLTGASISFYVLGTGFISTSLLTAGFYRLMGEWFSFDGGGMFALFAVSSIFASAAMFLGMKLFDKLPLLYAGLSTLSLSVIFTVFQISPLFRYRALSFIILQAAITAFIVFKKVSERPFSVHIRKAALISAFIYGAFAACYVLITIGTPTLFSYFIITAIIAQLLVYGIYKSSKALIDIEIFVSLTAVFMLSFTFEEKFSEHTAIIAAALLTIIVYAAHRIISVLKTNCSEITGFIAVIFVTIICLANISYEHFFIETSLCLISAVIVNSYSFSKNGAARCLAGLASPFIPYLTGKTIMDNNIVSQDHFTNKIICLSILAAFFTFYAAIINKLTNKEEKYASYALYSNLTAAGAILLSVPYNMTLSLIPAFICLIHFALSNRMKNNFTALFSSMAFIILVCKMTSYYSDNNITYISIALLITIIVYTILSRIMYPNAIFSKTETKTVIDPLMTVAFIGIILNFEYTRICIFFTLITSAVYCTGFIKKNTDETTASLLLTAAALLTSTALIIRPYFVFGSPEITSKVTIGIIALTGAVCRVIWKKFAKEANTAAQIIFIGSFIALLIDAMVFDTAANTIFVMSVMIFVLIISLFAKSKTWFITSAASLFIITLFASRVYLMALNWWIYLFIAGVLLIAIASVNEYCKKNNETLKTTVAKQFSDWTW